MQELLAKVPDIIQVVALVLSTITVVATVAVRLTPTKVDDAYVSKGAKMLVQVLRWLPTIGINPQTKKLEETIMELRESTNPGVSNVKLS